MFEEFRTLLARELEIDPSVITMDTNIIEDLGADSLDVIEIITLLEDEHGIFITDEEAKDLFTVRQVVEFLEAKM